MIDFRRTLTTTQTRSVALITAMLIARIATASPDEYFAIHIVDDQTGRGIPLVELHTTYRATYITDNNGYIAFLEPGLMGQKVWFDISSAGYESPSGPFGTKGQAFTIMAGQSVELKLHRTNLAERLYRMTGYGLYRDTVLLGKAPPIANGLLNAQVCGSDTVQVAVFKNRYYWFWQDTDRLSFPLGNFSMTGAVAPALPDQLNLDRGINFTYFTEKPNGFARTMTSVPQKDAHPVWVDGMTVVKDERGDEHMLAKYIIANKDLSASERGLLLWEEHKEVFEVLKKFDSKDTLAPGGHATRVRDGNQNYLYYPSPYLLVRVRDDFADASNPSNYEAYTCLAPGSTFSLDKPQLNRQNGKLIWTWQRSTRPIGPELVDAWILAKLLTREETPFQLRDADSGKELIAHGGSVAWNPYLKKWTMLFGQSFGDSPLGELWFAVANAPEGPWRDARKVASHAKKNDNNDCYNPLMHEELMRDGGRFIYFEGTFTNTFSGNPKQTPYYDYNNIMYRLDVADARLKFAEPPVGLSSAQPSE